MSEFREEKNCLFDELLYDNYVDKSSEIEKMLSRKRNNLKKLLESGSIKLLADEFQEAIIDYEKALKLFEEDDYPDEFNLTDIKINTIKFALCHSYLKVGNDDCIHRANEMLELLIISSVQVFPPNYYLYIKILLKNKMNYKALDITEDAISLVEKSPPFIQSWPATDVNIELSDINLLLNVLYKIKEKICFVEQLPALGDSYMPTEKNMSHYELEVYPANSLPEVVDNFDSINQTNLLVFDQTLPNDNLVSESTVTENNYKVISKQFKHFSTQTACNNIISKVSLGVLCKPEVSSIFVQTIELPKKYKDKSVMTMHTKNKKIKSEDTLQQEIKSAELETIKAKHLELQDIVKNLQEELKEQLKEMHELRKDKLKLINENSNLKVESKKEQKLHFKREEMSKEIISNMEKEFKENFNSIKVFLIYIIQHCFKTHEVIYDRMHGRSEGMLQDLKAIDPLLSDQSYPTKQELSNNMLQWEKLLNDISIWKKNLHKQQCSFLVQLAEDKFNLHDENYPIFPEVPFEPRDIIHENYQNLLTNFNMYFNYPKQQFYSHPHPHPPPPQTQYIQYLPMQPQRPTYYGPLPSHPIIPSSFQPTIHNQHQKFNVCAPPQMKEPIPKNQNQFPSNSDVSKINKTHIKGTENPVCSDTKESKISDTHKDTVQASIETKICELEKKSTSDISESLEVKTSNVKEIEKLEEQLNCAVIDEKHIASNRPQSSLSICSSELLEIKCGKENFSVNTLKSNETKNDKVVPLSEDNLKAHDSMVNLNTLVEEKAVVRPKGGTLKLINIIQSKFPNKTEEQCMEYIIKCRKKLGGSLKGLNGVIIMQNITDIIMEEDEKETSDKSAWLPVSNASVKWKKDDKSEECSICIDLISSNNSVTTLNCQHSFHTKCIQLWFHTESICPVCRKYSTLEADYPPLTRS